MYIQHFAYSFTYWWTLELISYFASGPITSLEIDGEILETVSDIIFLGSKITADGDCSHESKRHLLLGRKVMTNLDSILKSRDITLPTDSSGQAYGFSSGNVWMWELDYKESWVPKNGCFWIVVLEKTLERPLDCKEIQSVHPKGDQSWVFIGRTNAEAETPIVWPPHVKSWLIAKDPDAGSGWGQEEKWTTEDEMVGWHHWLDGHEFWVNSGSWWWTGRPGVLWFIESQRVGHDWVTELNWTSDLRSTDSINDSNIFKREREREREREKERKREKKKGWKDVREGENTANQSKSR